MFSPVAAFVLLVVGSAVILWLRRAPGVPTGSAPSGTSAEAAKKAANEGGAESAVLSVIPEERPSVPSAVSLPVEVPKQILRWVAGVSPPLVPMIPNAIPTSYRGKVEVVHGPNSTLVCQHLPHPGGKDYLLFQLEDMPLSEEELRRAQRSGATVAITLQNGRVSAAQVARQLDWGRGLWQQRSGWYRGGR
jgi:hypothetical protein